jgi:sigma-B regulation protein RsbU (phosphoserine phosphatase)
MAPDRRDLQLNALLGITQAINNNLPEADLFRIYKFTLLGDLKVKKMALFVNHHDQWEHRVDFGTKLKWSEIKMDNRFDELKSDQLLEGMKGFEEFKWVIPILHKDRMLGLLFLDDELSDHTFVKALSNIIIVAIENKRMARERSAQEAFQREMEIAKKVQNFLFPAKLPNTERLKIQATYLPHHSVGGDYYDYIKISESKFLICVADVSGKGVPAALLMSNFQATLKVLVHRTSDLKEIVEVLNKATFESGNAENFITFFLGIYDFDERSFEYINCGHNPLYLIQNKKLDKLERGTTVLGMFDPLPFIESVVVPDLNNFIFFGYTDGLTETFNEEDEQFGEERMEQMICSADDLSYLHNVLMQELTAFKGRNKFADDITILSCRVTNP